MVCAAHLINDGVTVDGDTVTVEWQGTGPSQANQNTQFNCRLDNGTSESCEILVLPFNLSSSFNLTLLPHLPHPGSSLSGFTESGLASGNHTLFIAPVINPECSRRFGLPVNFSIN